MYIYHINASLKDMKPIVDVIEDFNKDKLALWIPKGYATVEAVGNFDDKLVIYVNNAPSKVEDLKKFLQKAYDDLGGESFTQKSEMFVPGNMVELEYLHQNKDKVYVTKDEPTLLFKVKTPSNIPASQAFDIVNQVRELYETDDVTQKNIYIPDNLVEVEAI